MISLLQKKTPQYNRQYGFTIVELLIVIVVIAILAAIVIVAYNGIQQRANNTATIESVAAYARALESYGNQNNGTYPIALNYPCLGPNGVQCANVTDTTTPCNGTGATAYSASFDSAVHTIVSSIPAPSPQKITCSGKQYEGAWYNSSADGKSGYISYFLANTTDCSWPGGISNGGTYAFPGGIICYGNLPAL